MYHRQATIYGSPFLGEGALAVLKNLTWFEAVRIADPAKTSFEELLRYSGDFLLYFPEGQAVKDVELFTHYVVVSDLPQDESLRVVISPFDSLKTINVGVLAGLSGQYYRSPRLRRAVGSLGDNRES
jgi:hypothetical protein